MRALLSTRRARSFLTPFGAAVAALLIAWPSVVPAEASEATLDAAQQERRAVQQRLDEVLGRLDELQAQTAQIEDRVAQLRASAQTYKQTARRANGLMENQVADAYKQGRLPVAFALFTSDEPTEAANRARLIALLARQHRAEAEAASGANVRVAATAEQVAAAVEELEAREAELAAARKEVQAALAGAQAREEKIRAAIAAEEAARERAARQRAAREARPEPVSNTPSTPSGGGGGGGGSASVSGGTACPVGTPRSYSDTYGAPRSGGRSHLGTDILAPQGTPSYAIESGRIERMNSSSLGGISLYLRGDSGNLYFYTHLSGYASGASVGKQVSAGALIAYVGDTGNAAGIPHLHFEVMPGGGSNVNPYPYVLRACG